MGYDTSLFLHPILKDLFCSICHNVFERPVYLPLCRHVFCTDCILRWLEEGNNTKRCPIDKTAIKYSKEQIKKKEVSYVLSNIIKDSIVMCKNRNNGCKETFSLSAFAEHLKVCKFKDDETDATTPIQSTSQENSTTNTVKETQIAAKKQNMCKRNHSNKNNFQCFLNPNFINDKKLVKLTFTSLPESVLPNNLASCLKTAFEVDVNCIHTESKFSNSTKDFTVFVSEQDYEKVLKPELWPSQISILAELDHKQIKVKGSLKVKRSENFFGLNPRDAKSKQHKKAVRDEKKEKRVKKRNRNRSKKVVAVEKEVEKQGDLPMETINNEEKDSADMLI